MQLPGGACLVLMLLGRDGIIIDIIIISIVVVVVVAAVLYEGS